MTTEYWLQKKTIGGWSHVTWYSNQVEAKRNFDASSSGLSGYSWRLVSVEVSHEKMLEEVVKVEAPIVELLKPVYKMQPPQDKPKSSGWGDVAKTGWNSTSDKPSHAVFKPEPSDHGLSGSVWLVHHGLKKKTRVASNLVDDMMKQGYERGSPRTQFKS